MGEYKTKAGEHDLLAKIPDPLPQSWNPQALESPRTEAMGAARAAHAHGGKSDHAGSVPEATMR